MNQITSQVRHDRRSDTHDGIEMASAATDLVKVYGSGATAVRAVDGISVGFARGTFTAIMGASGSGKSTLMHCLAGLDSPTSGSITVGGTEITALRDRDLTVLRRDRIGFVFQSFNLLPTLTAGQNITLPLDLAGRAVDDAVFNALVASLGITHRLRHLPGELSGGEQQRVAIARALIGSPDVVFADEPTGQLDSATGHGLLAYLRSSVRELGRTVVMVTHDPIAAAYADRAVLLADGRIAGELAKPSAADLLAAMAQLNTTGAAGRRVDTVGA